MLRTGVRRRREMHWRRENHASKSRQQDKRAATTPDAFSSLCRTFLDPFSPKKVTAANYSALSVHIRFLKVRERHANDASTYLPPARINNGVGPRSFPLQPPRPDVLTNDAAPSIEPKARNMGFDGRPPGREGSFQKKRGRRLLHEKV